MLCFVRFGFDSFPLGKVGIVDRSPSPALPKGRELIPAEFKDVGVLLLPLGEGWDGASMLGWGFRVGWYAPPATL